MRRERADTMQKLTSGSRTQKTLFSQKHTHTLGVFLRASLLRLPWLAKEAPLQGGADDDACRIRGRDGRNGCLRRRREARRGDCEWRRRRRWSSRSRWLLRQFCHSAPQNISRLSLLGYSRGDRRDAASGGAQGELRGRRCVRAGRSRKKKKKKRFSFSQFPEPTKKKKKKNKQARSTSTSSRALKLLASKPENAGFDLVLKDHDPPKASARRFLAALRRNRRAIPVVVLSSSAAAASTAARDADAAMQGDNAKKCLAAGAADVLSGPLSLDECSNLYARVFWWRRVSQLLER